MESWTGRTRADGANWRTGELANGVDYGILDWADWDRRADEAEGSLWVELGGRKGRTGKPGMDVRVD